MFRAQPAAEQAADLGNHGADVGVLPVVQPVPAVRDAHRRLRARLAAYHAGEISFAEFDAGIRGWIAHVGHADSWGLRERVLDSLAIRPAERRRALATDPTVAKRNMGDKNCS